MLVSKSWLEEYVDLDTDPAALAHGLTMAGLEVEGVTDRYAYLNSVVAGRIARVSPHPDADRLAVCRVEVGGGTLDVVCGAPNAREGMVSAVALPGTRLPSGAIVAEGMIRGTASRAMLCSEAELGLGDAASGILELPEETKPGKKIAEILGLSDVVFDIGITPNRPDCLSMIGMAREAAALLKKPLKIPEISLNESATGINEKTSITIEAPDHCPRYAARLVLGVQIGPSPSWLQKRLLSVGQRPINNIVDVTNFVMLEMGQPLHAFDFDTLEEGRIVVRTAAEGEAFTTLDDQERSLTADTLMICDGKKPVAVAGVMGGQNSEISENTVNVLIESACFNPMSVRKTARRMGFHTEASHRFERGTDPDGAIPAVDRAAQLMVLTAGGEVAGGLIDAYPAPFPEIAVSLSCSRANDILGTELSRETMKDLLSSVALFASEEGEDRLVVKIPSFRRDISRPEDLVEEVARLWGYDKIPVAYPALDAKGSAENPLLSYFSRIKGTLMGMGFQEAICYSFSSPQTPGLMKVHESHPFRRMVKLENPLTEGQGVLRTSLLPGLLETLHRNQNRGNRNIRLFELGKAFFKGSDRELPLEREMLALVMTGTRRPDSWMEKGEPLDFYDVKGVCESLLKSLKLWDLDFSPIDTKESPYLDPGRSAVILSGKWKLGILGKVSEEVLASFGIKEKALVMELDTLSLLDSLPEITSFDPPSNYPPTDRDVTLIVDRDVEAGTIMSHIRGQAHVWVESVDILSVYEGKPIPKGKKSLSFRVTYRSREETLKDEPVNQLHQRISQELIDAFKATLPAA